MWQFKTQSELVNVLHQMSYSCNPTNQSWLYLVVQSNAIVAIVTIVRPPAAISVQIDKLSSQEDYTHLPAGSDPNWWTSASGLLNTLLSVSWLHDSISSSESHCFNVMRLVIMLFELRLRWDARRIPSRLPSYDDIMRAVDDPRLESRWTTPESIPRCPFIVERVTTIMSTDKYASMNVSCSCLVIVIRIRLPLSLNVISVWRHRRKSFVGNPSRVDKWGKSVSLNVRDILCVILRFKRPCYNQFTIRTSRLRMVINGSNFTRTAINYLFVQLLGFRFLEGFPPKYPLLRGMLICTLPANGYHCLFKHRVHRKR